MNKIRIVFSRGFGPRFFYFLYDTGSVIRGVRIRIPFLWENGSTSLSADEIEYDNPCIVVGDECVWSMNVFDSEVYRKYCILNLLLLGRVKVNPPIEPMVLIS